MAVLGRLDRDSRHGPFNYYTDDPIYDNKLIFGGEVHAAVFVGKETYRNGAGKPTTREIALTKNGRSDLDFLIFQDVRGLDETYCRPREAIPRTLTLR